MLFLANTGVRHGTEALGLCWCNIEWYERDGERYLAVNVDGKTNKRTAEPPHLNWSSAMFRKRRTDNDEQTTEAGRDYHEVEAS